MLHDRHELRQLDDLLGSDGGLSGSSSASSSASTSVSNTTTSGGGLNIWEILFAVIGLLILGLFLTLHKK